MCGIAGFVDLGQRFGPDRIRAIIEAMNATIEHRGPDDHGVWVDPHGRCGLAHRRLSIVDLSPLGRQPMVDDSGLVGMTFNGEIYNFKRFRQCLESQGLSFKSDCDAEVLLAMMGDQRSDHLSELRGLFGFATYNARTGQLMLVRDPFGKKPLYYAQGNGWFAFASELRALEVLEELDRTIEPDQLSDYLFLQYVHAPQTIYRGVKKLEPGVAMTVSLDGTTSTRRYFEFRAGSPEPTVELAPTYEGRVAQLGALIEGAVKRRLLSDVPLGAFLSGGVDSALVVAMMKRLGVHTKTYSVGFEDSPESEHVFAREIANHLGSEHHELIVRPDAIELAPMIADALDEPNGDSSCLPTNLLSEFTRRHVTVAISGDGGDEMFGGYGRYFDTLNEWSAPDRPESWLPSSAYLGARWSIFQPEDIDTFLGHRPARLASLLERWSRDLRDGSRHLLHRMRNVDVESYLPGAVLAKVDRMSMQYALEVRCPLLDPDVAAFAAALPVEDLLDHQHDENGRPSIQGKRILKDVLARDLPREWVDRRKRGFGLPGGFWDGPALRSFAHDVLGGPSTRLHGLMDKSALLAWLERQEDPSHFSIYRLWPMLVLELWLRKQHAPTVSMR